MSFTLKPGTIATCPLASTVWEKSKPGGRVLLRRLVYIAFFIEVGLLLIVLPWSTFWEENYFARAWPPIEPIFINNFVRGGISGLGFVNLVAAGSELLSLFSVRRRETPLGGAGSADTGSYPNGTDARVEP